MPEPLLSAITVEPKTKADACIFWLHGLGADGHDFVDAIPYLGLSNHAIRFVFPNAPLQSVTLNGGMMMPSWYDITALDLHAVQDDVGIKKSQQAVGLLIEQAINEGIPSNRILLMGFSQGGALALHTALRFEQSLGGAAVLSAYLPLHHLLSQERHVANAALPIFIAHGLMDPIVAYWMGQKSLACLEAAGYQPTFRSYPIAHTVSNQELLDLGQWIKDLLL